MNMWRRQQHQGVATIWLTEEERYGDGGLLSGVVLARSHPCSTFYFGIVILCTLINKAWLTYNKALNEPFVVPSRQPTGMEPMTLYEHCIHGRSGVN